MHAFPLCSSRIGGQVPDDVLITNPFEPMDLGRVTASDDLPNGGVSGEAEGDANMVDGRTQPHIPTTWRSAAPRACWAHQLQPLK